MSLFGNSKKRPQRKTNRVLTPEERLARNISRGQEPAKAAGKRRSHGHAKPLGTSAPDHTERRRRSSKLGRWLSGIFAPVRSSLTGEWLGGPEVIRHLPFVGFIVLLMLGYTYLEYQYEYDERAIKEGRKELRNLRHHEQSLRGRFESELQRSQLDEDMADVGLAAPVAPPTMLPSQVSPSP